MNKCRIIVCLLLAIWAITGFVLGAEKKVFIVAGQSNAVGFGSSATGLPPDLQAPQTDVMFWFEEGPWNAITNPNLRIRSNGWIDLQYQSDPNFGTFGGPVDGFGPEILLGRTFAETLPDDVAIIKFAINATSLAEDWNAATPGPLYNDLVSIVNAAMADLSLQGHTGELRGFFWMQGEWDARNATFAGAYEANLTFFIQQVRTVFSAPDLPFVLGRLHSEIYKSPYGISQVDLETVRTAQQNVAATVPGASMVDTDDLPLISDFIHFPAEGQLLLGFRFALAYFALEGPEPLNLTDRSTLVLYQGDKVWHSVVGPAGSLYVVFFSLGGGPLNTPYGVMGLHFPITQILTANLNAYGYHTLPLVIPDITGGPYTLFTHALVDHAPPLWAGGGNNPNGSGSIQWGLNE